MSFFEGPKELQQIVYDYLACDWKRVQSLPLDRDQMKHTTFLIDIHNTRMVLSYSYVGNRYDVYERKGKKGETIELVHAGKFETADKIISVTHVRNTIVAFLIKYQEMTLVRIVDIGTPTTPLLLSNTTVFAPTTTTTRNYSAHRIFSACKTLPLLIINSYVDTTIIWNWQTCTPWQQLPHLFDAVVSHNDILIGLTKDHTVDVYIYDDKFEKQQFFQTTTKPILSNIKPIGGVGQIFTSQTNDMVVLTGIDNTDLFLHYLNTDTTTIAKTTCLVRFMLPLTTNVNGTLVFSGHYNNKLLDIFSRDGHKHSSSSIDLSSRLESLVCLGPWNMLLVYTNTSRDLYLSFAHLVYKEFNK